MNLESRRGPPSQPSSGGPELSDRPGYPDGQCSRTAGVPHRWRRKVVSSSFNISNIVTDTTTTHSKKSGGAGSIPVGIVMARQRVTQTTDMEIVTSQLQSTPAFHPQLGLMSPILPPPLAPPLAPPLVPPLASPLAPPLLPPLPSHHSLNSLQSAVQPHAFPPYYAYHDHHYFNYLQQQLLLLHHHHQYQLQSQASHPLNLSIHEPQAFPNMNYLQSLENSVKSIKHSEQEVDFRLSCAEDLCNQPEKSVNVEPNNNEIQDKFEESSHTEEAISVGDEKETEVEEREESFINVEEEEQSKKRPTEELETEVEQRKEEDRSGLFLLAEAALPQPHSRKMRGASIDCSGLRMLCHAADRREQAATAARSGRSKSLDCSFSNEVGRNVKQFVASKSVNLSSDSPSEDKLDSMAAWELDLRIRMAEKQKKYNEINRKLLKIQKIKKKSIKKDKNKIKIRKVKKKIKYEVQRRQSKEQDQRPEDPQPDPTPVQATVSQTQDTSPEEEDEKPQQVTNNFRETFQKFQQSYLSRTGGDVRLTTSKAKKIPTLENWTTIMQGKRKNKDFIKEENKSEVVYSEETCINNNIFENSISTKTGDKYLMHEKKSIKTELYKETEAVKLSESEHSLNEVDHDNNNKHINWEPEESEETFLSFKKKLKKKHKQQSANKVVEFEASEKVLERKKKKKKKEKKRDKDKKSRRKERKERKESREDCPPKLVAAEDSNVGGGASSDIPPRLEPEPEQGQSCLLSEADLVDGLRVLLRLGGHFYTSRLTEISPPDIYGIVVDKERGNKPHILSREEVLSKAVRDVRPASVSVLTAGKRVCAYWSSKMTYLHPGTVTAPDTDNRYVVIQLDDGDSRDIHIDQVRYLPHNYPFVEADAHESITGILSSRKRGYPTSASPLQSKRVETDTKKPSRNKEKKKKQKDTQWSVSVTEISTDNLEEKCPDVADVEAEPSSAEDKMSSSNNKSAIAAFLPPQHSLWSWSDPGWRVSSKSRRVFHKSIKAGGGESLQVGDCAVFLSTSRPDRPYIGRIHSMWATTTGNMKVQVRWFYHPAEVEGTAVGGGRVEDLRISNGLFASSHSDENDVQTISHKCHLLDFSDYTARLQDGLEDTEDLYYLAGDYDPVVGTINFKPGVIHS